MKQRYFSAIYLWALFTLSPLSAQDTLSFGGIYDLPGAEVRATYTPVSPLAQSFTIEEVYRLPGTFYDPARLVALLPGVVQTNDQANHLSVRGNTPNANLWRLNGLAIVNPNHTANAGTFYDFPTLNGGGVNAISAQMLDNSGFLAGGLPVEYGFATGGTFDLRLRPGSKTRRKYQAQAGFIGFDLMAEGPIGNSGQTSYLVNGRYSFTGLLADMGVDFGGEEIRFADVNAHLHHEWAGGEISAFAIVGQSSNVFSGPDSTEQEITEQKELFDIDFESDVNIVGVTFKHDFNASGFSGGFAHSVTNSTRNQSFSGGGPVVSDQELTFTQLSGNLIYNRILTEKSSIKAGVEFFQQGIDMNSSFPFGTNPLLTNEDLTVTATAPFMSYSIYLGNHAFEFGARGSRFSSSLFKQWVVEPRFNWTYRGRKSTITLMGEQVAQPAIQELLTAKQGEFRNELFIPVGFQLSLRYGRKVGPVNVAITGFVQERSEEYASEDFVSMNSFLEIGPDVEFTKKGYSRRVGAELEASGGMKSKGWYYRGNITWLNSQASRGFGGNRDGRFDIPLSGTLMIGREWAGEDKKSRPRTFGVNLALIAHSNERYRSYSNRPVSSASSLLYFRAPDGEGFTRSYRDYFRPDLRLYKTKTRPKTTTTLALDLQNVAGIENVGNVYYDAFLERPNERLQLGLIPVLSYRIVWR